MPVTEEEDRSANASVEVAGLEQRQADLVSSQEQAQQEIARLATQFQLLNNFSTNLIVAGENSGTAALTDMKTVG